MKYPANCKNLIQTIKKLRFIHENTEKTLGFDSENIRFFSKYTTIISSNEKNVNISIVFVDKLAVLWYNLFKR